MSNKFGLKERDLEDIISILQQQPQVESAVIFGSRAKGNYKNGSDVDIALRGDLVNLQVISQISYLLNEETFMPYKFDIVNYNSIQNNDLVKHIDSIGIPFYKKMKQKV
jgi:uncharacterized protein